MVSKAAAVEFCNNERLQACTPVPLKPAVIGASFVPSEHVPLTWPTHWLPAVNAIDQFATCWPLQVKKAQEKSLGSMVTLPCAGCLCKLLAAI